MRQTYRNNRRLDNSLSVLQVTSSSEVFLNLTRSGIVSANYQQCSNLILGAKIIFSLDKRNHGEEQTDFSHIHTRALYTSSRSFDILHAHNDIKRHAESPDCQRTVLCWLTCLVEIHFVVRASRTRQQY